MDQYERQKRKLRNLVNRFELEDDLFLLVEANKVLINILEIEAFPIQTTERKFRQYFSKEEPLVGANPDRKRVLKVSTIVNE
jgi:hypothetical protein